MNVSLKKNENKKEIWEIWLDDEIWREVHRAIFGKKPVFPPLKSPAELQEIFDLYEYQRVRKYVVWRLSKQCYHSEQLAKLLKDRLVQKHTILRVLEEFQFAGFINDENWIESFIRNRQKKYSLRIIISKLHHKGISWETLNRIAKDSQNPETEIKAIVNFIEGRSRSKDLSDHKTRQKLIASLLRKGYLFEQIQEAFNTYN